MGLFGEFDFGSMLGLEDVGGGTSQGWRWGGGPSGVGKQGTGRSGRIGSRMGEGLWARAIADTFRWWDLRTLSQVAQLDLGDPVTSMELAHGGGTLSVTAGKNVHFLDILR